VTASFRQPVHPPAFLRHPRFVLEPLGPQHNERDAVAWMSSIEHIRATPGFQPDQWAGDAWPYEMSVDDNAADLQNHADEFVRGEAFAYTVLDDEGDVIGCVYIDPDPTGECDAMCRLWVRASHAAHDGDLFDAVAAWLASDDWPFVSARFPGRR
jgi:hypothetical protein